MLPEHFRTSDETNGTDTTTYSVNWTEKNGFGFLIVLHEIGEVVGRVSHGEPIDATTDSWEIANKVVAELGMVGPAWVDHDGSTIFFAQHAK